MKTICRFSVVLIAVLSSVRLPAQEMLIINETIEWNMESTHGYYFFDRPASTPTNWLSPHDYYNGQFYTRYEIISEATSEPCGIQVGIWQWRLPSSVQEGQKTYSEVMAEIITLNGPGSVEFNNSSPATWWYSYEGVDFSRAYDFWRLGINIWSLDPRSVIAPSNWGGNDDLWATRDKWFPIQVHVTVVAVASGHTFSGWGNYTGNVPSTPAYTINYANETTSEIVPPTDEYSLSSDMSNAVSGTSTVVPLTPGQNRYFRTKAVGETPASGIQQLTVPARPPKPGFTYDISNQRTAETVSSEYEYATDISMSDATSGEGTYVYFPPGATRYFRKIATTSAFKSEVQDITGISIPVPEYEVDFLNERTKTPVSEDDEYSFDSFATEAISGTGTYLNLTPGQDVYFRTKAVGETPSSGIQTLKVPQRHAAPVFEIDYTAETLASAITSTIEYKRNSETQWNSGAGEVPGVVPGDTFIFRNRATVSSFHSDEFILNVPERPATPDFTIDFGSEATSTTVPASIIYADNPEMTGFTTASGIEVQVIPGEDIYFMQAATGSSFKSGIQYLELPEKPSAPVFEIDFVNEITTTNVTESIEYSTSSTFTVSNIGNNAPLPLEAGSALYFRVNHTSSSFRSLTQTMDIPPRPLLLGANAADTITESPFSINAIFLKPVTGFDLASLEVTNGTLTNLRSEYIFDFNVTATNSLVSVKIPANIVNEGNFVSNVYTKYFNGIIQSINEFQAPSFIIFPNPFSDMVTITTMEKTTGQITITLLDITGRVVYHSTQEMQNAILLDLGNMNIGTYFVTLKSTEGIYTKIINKVY